MKKCWLLIISFFFSAIAFTQFHTQLSADEWVDSVIGTLSHDQRIAQLMVVRLSELDASTKRVNFLDQQVEDAVKKYNVGGICLFQGGPVRQVNLINHFQQLSKTPILICIDGEIGVGMRVDSIVGWPRQMMIGATQDPELMYRYGKAVAEQCKRMGIHVNYAPVVDINNNPQNPVINDRSFGENKQWVSALGIAYMKGLQENGIMACAKHFPGHGDVAVDSHKDLPVILKSRTQLDSLELVPFRDLIDAGIASVMVGHLNVPSIDNALNRPTSISYNTVTKLLRDELKFKGLTFTDALEMKGVTKYFPDGAASVESLIAGNDMLCLPGDVGMAINKIKLAIKRGKLRWSDIDAHVRKVLRAKYDYGVANTEPPFHRPHRRGSEQYVGNHLA